MAKVKLESVYKVYEGGVRAVNDFNLDIPDKEFVVFVGPSGCGKSTTLRMIAGLEDITQGKLYIDDEVVNDVDSKNRDIAMVFQNYALYPHMTVYQNMAFGLKLRHTPKKEIDERVKKAAEILEISELLTRKPKALSGGQRQRVALGRAIVREPKVFLLDEPLSNLDAKLRVQMRSEITKLHNRLKTTFIYVTHDQTEAMTMGTRIVVMKDGFIQQVDSPVALFEDPCNLFVATFLGSPQMNILPAKLSLNRGKMCATLIGETKETKLVFSNTKMKQLASDSYFGKEVILGIRPEAIKIDPNGQLDALIEVVEQLGDETILYCKIKGIDKNIIVKMPFAGHIKTNQIIRLSLNMDRVHLFDKDNQKSILGIRSNNNFACIVSSSSIAFGKTKFEIPAYLKNRILHDAYDKNLVASAKVDDISLMKQKDAFKLPIDIQFKEQKTDYIAAYFKIPGLDNYFVIKLNNDIKAMPKSIYIPFNKIEFLDEDNHIVNSKEIIYKNLSKGIMNVEGEISKLRCFGTTFTLPTKPGYKSGQCLVEILPIGPEVVFNKKLAKEQPLHNKEISNNRITFTAYDEYKANGKNFIYGKVKEASNYVTFYVPDDFSVYKMDKFIVQVPDSAIIVKYAKK